MSNLQNEIDSDDDQDYEVKKAAREAKKYKHNTEKGRKMARIVAEFILLRFFFRDIKDRKKIAVAKALF